MFVCRIAASRRFPISSYNIHRLLISCILVASKLYEDRTFNNTYYSHVGGISTNALNNLELSLLSLLNYNLHVPPQVFEEYRQRVESVLVASELRSRHGASSSQPTPLHMCASSPTAPRSVRLVGSEEDVCEALCMHASPPLTNRGIIIPKLRRSKSETSEHLSATLAAYKEKRAQQRPKILRSFAWLDLL